MTFPVINADESTDVTIKWLDENYDRAEQEGVLLSECKIYQRGKYIVVEFGNGKIGYYEHDGKYCYILDAIEYMKPEVPAKWKTLDKLATFRQAIRECTAQGMGLEDLYQFGEGITQEQYKEFISVVRVYDKRHHGSVTF